MPKATSTSLAHLITVVSLASGLVATRRCAAEDAKLQPPLTLSVSSNNVLTLTWSAVPGQSYLPMSLTSLEDRVWKPLADLYWIQAKDATVTLSVPSPPGSQRFIHVVTPAAGPLFEGQIPTGNDNLSYYAGDYYYFGTVYVDNFVAPEVSKKYGQFPLPLRRSLKDVQMLLKESYPSNIYQAPIGALLQRIEDGNLPIWRILNNEGTGAATNHLQIYESLLSDPRVQYLQPVYYQELDRYQVKVVKGAMYIALRDGVPLSTAVEELRTLGVTQPQLVYSGPEGYYIAGYKQPPRFEVFKLSRAISALSSVKWASPPLHSSPWGSGNP